MKPLDARKCWQWKSLKTKTNKPLSWNLFPNKETLPSAPSLTILVSLVSTLATQSVFGGREAKHPWKQQLRRPGVRGWIRSRAGTRGAQWPRSRSTRLTSATCVIILPSLWSVNKVLGGQGCLSLKLPLSPHWKVVLFIIIIFHPALSSYIFSYGWKSENIWRNLRHKSNCSNLKGTPAILLVHQNPKPTTGLVKESHNWK